MVAESAPPPIPADAILVQRALDGDAEAFAVLYDRYAVALYRFSYAHVGNRQDAEDLTAETFLRAWDNLSTYRHRGHPFSAYLYRIIRNLLADHYRKFGPLYSTDSANLDLLAETTQLGQQLEYRQQAEKLQCGLLALNPDYRSVLILRFINELPSAEVARIMGRSPGALRVMQYRALAALRKQLQASEE